MTRSGRPSIAKTAALLAAATIALTACSGVPRVADPPEKVADNIYKRQSEIDQEDRIFGEGGLRLFGRRDDAGQGGGGIGVNSFLWRASLDTISFMPLASAGPFGGVIITDWYTPPDSPGERFKLTVYILDRRLRADGLRVAMFRQERKDSNEWLDTKINPSARTIIEDAILTRARELRINSEASL